MLCVDVTLACFRRSVRPSLSAQRSDAARGHCAGLSPVDSTRTHSCTVCLERALAAVFRPVPGTVRPLRSIILAVVTELDNALWNVGKGLIRVSGRSC